MNVNIVSIGCRRKGKTVSETRKASNIHVLKCWPEAYRDIVSGIKAYEYRRNDRGFEIGDYLVLKEWNPKTKEYTGEVFTVIVTHITKGPLYRVRRGYCVMAIREGSQYPTSTERFRELQAEKDKE